jgi:hypothetical protein
MDGIETMERADDVRTTTYDDDGRIVCSWTNRHDDPVTLGRDVGTWVRLGLLPGGSIEVTGEAA